MKKTVHTSRAGLTRCARCRSHIRLHESVAQTVCPFCDARLLDEERGLVKRALDLATTGRGGLIAGALAGALALSGCGDSATGSAVDAGPDIGQGENTWDGGGPDIEPTPDIEVADDVPEAPVGDVYGAPPLDAEVIPDVPEAPVGDVYGAPPLDADQ